MSPESDVRLEIEKLEQRFAENSKGRVFAHLADAYRKAGEFAKAEGLILHGLKNHPNYISAYIVLGRVYLDGQRSSDAHAQFSKVLELDPQNLIALKALGDLAVRSLEFGEARSWYDRMLQIDPRNVEALQGLEDLERKREGVASTGQTPLPAVTAADGELGADPTEGSAGPAAEEAPAAEDEAETAGESAEPDLPEETPQPGALAAEGDEPEVVSEIAAAGMPWQLMDGPADESPTAPSEPEAAAVAGLDEIPSGRSDDAVEREASTAETPPEDVQDVEFDLEGMESWTPGFLRDEDMMVRGAGDRESGDPIDDLSAGLDLSLGGEAAEVSETESSKSSDEEKGSEEESDTGMVTETMAEIYASQGLVEDALRVYRRLAESNPDDPSIQESIVELERRLDRAELEAAAEPAEDSSEPLAFPTPPAGEEFRFALQAPPEGLDDADPFAASLDAAITGAVEGAPEIGGPGSLGFAPSEASAASTDEEVPASAFASPTADLEALAAELEGAEHEVEAPTLEPEAAALDAESPAAELEDFASELEARPDASEAPAPEFEVPASEFGAATSDFEVPAEFEPPSPEVDATSETEPEPEMPAPEPEVESPSAELEAVVADAEEATVETDEVDVRAELAALDDVTSEPEAPAELEVPAAEADEPVVEYEAADEPVVEHEEAAPDEAATDYGEPAIPPEVMVSEEDLWAKPAAAADAEAVGATIETYLIGLLDFSPDVAPRGLSAEAGFDEDDSSSRDADGESSEDLARFQEWLKGLKR